jgi:hypothetical protein
MDTRERVRIQFLISIVILPLPTEPRQDILTITHQGSLFPDSQNKFS